MDHKKLMATARLTGVWYLLLAISGVLGFLIFHPKIFVTNDPQQTLSNLTALETTARIRLVLEVLIIASQALTAVGFYKLFREIKPWAAFAVGTWGLLNSAAIMMSAVAMGAAIGIAAYTTPSFQEKVMAIQLLSSIMSNAWVIGGLFFGLWLIPMGYTVVSTGCMPLWLGRILMIGGVGYLLGTLIRCAGFTHPLAGMLTLPATIGEFWMIGYLLIYGIRPLTGMEPQADGYRP